MRLVGCAVRASIRSARRSAPDERRAGHVDAGRRRARRGRALGLEDALRIARTTRVATSSASRSYRSPAGPTVSLAWRIASLSWMAEVAELADRDEVAPWRLLADRDGSRRAAATTVGGATAGSTAIAPSASFPTLGPYQPGLEATGDASLTSHVHLVSGAQRWEPPACRELRLPPMSEATGYGGLAHRNWRESCSDERSDRMWRFGSSQLAGVLFR